MTPKNSDTVKIQSVGSLVIKNAVISIKRALKENEYAVPHRLSAYFARSGAWKFSQQKKKRLNIHRRKLSKKKTDKTRILQFWNT